MTDDEKRLTLRAWLDRGPSEAWADVSCGRCGAYRCNHDRNAGRCLIAGVECAAFAPPWRSWFADGEYLGCSSARTGPDLVPPVQPCLCPTCESGRNGPGRPLAGPPLNERGKVSP